jgi:hypothetical protein
LDDLDLTVYTRNRAAEARCPACQVHNLASRAAWPEDDDTIPEALPDHTCRRPPAVPQTVRAARVRAAHETFTERELRIRRERLADINSRP